MSAVTVATWVNLSQLPASGQNYIPVGKDSSDQSYRITIGSNGKGDFVVKTTNNAWYSAGTAASFTTVLALNTWYHIVGTYDGTTVRVYVNGALQGSGSQSISGSIFNSPSAVRFGYESDAAGIDYMKGKVDEVQIYNRALSSTDVMNLYSSY